MFFTISGYSKSTCEDDETKSFIFDSNNIYGITTEKTFVYVYGNDRLGIMQIFFKTTEDAMRAFNTIKTKLDA